MDKAHSVQAPLLVTDPKTNCRCDLRPLFDFLGEFQPGPGPERELDQAIEFLTTQGHYTEAVPGGFNDCFFTLFRLKRMFEQLHCQPT